MVENLAVKIDKVIEDSQT